MWQELIVGTSVVVAVAFIVRRYWPNPKKSTGGCSGCSGCGSEKSCKS